MPGFPQNDQPAASLLSSEPLPSPASPPPVVIITLPGVPTAAFVLLLPVPVIIDRRAFVSRRHRCTTCLHPPSPPRSRLFQLTATRPETVDGGFRLTVKAIGVGGG
ncbi:unnamed protein product [Linum trigynum]|uniref:Uncharacterized protein n=1 Tax=Linum trigynum TaxID=586398 RepID=A0AAV2CGE2_9ROSI